MSSFISHFIACMVGGTVGIAMMLAQMEPDPPNMVRCVKCRHRDRRRGECELLSAYECAVDSMWPVQCEPLDGCTFGEERKNVREPRRASQGRGTNTNTTMRKTNAEDKPCSL